MHAPCKKRRIVAKRIRCGFSWVLYCPLLGYGPVVNQEFSLLEQIKEESKDTLATLDEGRITCRKEIEDNEATIQSRTTQRQENADTIRDDVVMIDTKWREWNGYRVEELQISGQVEAIQKERQDACNIMTIETDDRNKAIDCLIKVNIFSPPMFRIMLRRSPSDSSRLKYLSPEIRVA